MSFSPVAGAAKKAGLSTLQRVVLGGLVVTLAGSAMLRAVHHSPDLGNGPGPGSSFVGVDTSAAEGRIEAWLPGSIAPDGSRAVWTGESVLVATPIGPEGSRAVSVRRFQCERAALVRTDR